MSFTNCFEISSMVIDEASNRFHPSWEISEDRLDIFKGYCDVVDSLAREFDGVSVESEVDETTMKVVISLECDEVIVQSRNHIFYELINRTVECGFSVSDEGNLIVKFVFPSLWDKA